VTQRQSVSREDLDRCFNNQLKLLLHYINEYDKGERYFSRPISGIIRLLVHDKGGAKSILSQVGRKEIMFYDTSFPVCEKSEVSYSGITTIAYSKNNEFMYVAPLDRDGVGPIKMVDFISWWRSEIFIDARGNHITREDLVLSMAEQDGGVHKDSGLNQPYADLSRNNSMRWVIENGVSSAPLYGVEEAAVRQIAHELLKTLIPGYKKNRDNSNDAFLINNVTLEKISDNDVHTDSKSKKNIVMPHRVCPSGAKKSK